MPKNDYFGSLVYFAEKHRRVVAVFFFLLVFGLGMTKVHLRGVTPMGDGKSFEVLALNLIRYKAYTWGDGFAGTEDDFPTESRKAFKPYCNWAPLHPALLALLISASKGDYYIVGLANSLWLAITALFVFLLAQKVSHDIRVVIISALLFAATLPFYGGLTNFYREPLYIFLVTATVYFLVRSLHVEKFTWWSVSAGFSWALSILCKPILMILIPFYLIFRFFVRNEERTRVKSLLQGIYIVVIVMLVCSFWTIRNIRQGLGPVLIASAGHASFMWTVGEHYDTGGLYDLEEGEGLVTEDEVRGLNASQIDRLVYRRKLEKLVAMPSRAVKILIRNAILLLYFMDSAGRVHVTYLVAFPFFIVGFWKTYRSKGAFWQARALLMTIIIVYYLGLLTHVATPGYRLIVEPLLFIIAACGMVEVQKSRLLARNSRRKIVFWAGYLLFCGIFSFAYTPDVRVAVARVVNSWF